MDYGEDRRVLEAIAGRVGEGNDEDMDVDVRGKEAERVGVVGEGVWN